MEIVVGPVLMRKGGYPFDCWTPSKGLTRGALPQRRDVFAMPWPPSVGTDPL
jgi:hypothetical protein